VKASPSPLLSSIKSLSYLERLVISQRAQDAGGEEALVVSEDGLVLEAAFAGVFWECNGRWETPGGDLPILASTTLRLVEDCLSSMGKKLYRVQKSSDEVLGKASIYLCNALMGVQPVASVDGRACSRPAREREFLKTFQEYWLGQRQKLQLV
jgi:branched-subunit amino acid aminotransferase/4-amino-4-deoxychorismate lyase